MMQQTDRSVYLIAEHERTAMTPLCTRSIGTQIVDRYDYLSENAAFYQLASITLGGNNDG
jgi:hypothetical protein